MKPILAIDPGTTESGYVILNEGIPINFGKIPNNELLKFLYSHRGQYTVVIEMMASYGKRVGKTVFETCVWIGRFIEAGYYISSMPALISRKEIAKHLNCTKSKGRDASIRAAIIKRFGNPGTKKNPGILLGVHYDMWQALALGLTYYDTHKEEPATSPSHATTLPLSQ